MNEKKFVFRQTDFPDLIFEEFYYNSSHSDLLYKTIGNGLPKTPEVCCSGS
jgi:hypothetical protein